MLPLTSISPSQGLYIMNLCRDTLPQYAVLWIRCISLTEVYLAASEALRICLFLKGQEKSRDKGSEEELFVKTTPMKLNRGHGNLELSAFPQTTNDWNVHMINTKRSSKIKIVRAYEHV